MLASEPHSRHPATVYRPTGKENTMNGKIDARGWLHIERAGSMKAQECPIFGDARNVDSVRCGDWCPLFGEPEKQETSFPEGCHTTILLCHERELTFDTFTDERGGVK